MEMAHKINLALHIGIGAIGMLIGLMILLRQKGTSWHRRMGRAFAIAALMVSATAAIGLMAFRFLPMFAVLTVLTSYQLLSGWRAARTKAEGPALADAVLTLAAIVVTALLLPYVLSAPAHGSTQPVVILSTLATLGTILFYDALRWLFPRRWFARLWRFEHIYKLIASFSALTSAFAGNVLRDLQPWSQVAPSIIGSLLIFFFFFQNARSKSTATSSVAPPLQ
jgi:uncharacterized membrane protein